MLFLNLIYHRIFRVAIVACIAVVLAGCPSLPHQSVSDDGSSPSYYYLDKMADTSGSAQIDYQILAARALLREGNITKAEQLLNSLPKDLNDNQLKEGFLLAGEIQVAKRSPNNARIALSKLIANQLTPNQQIRYYQIQIKSADKKDMLTQLRAYVALEQLVDNGRKQEVINDSWDVLSSMSASTLNSLVINADENTLRGWLDLVRIYADNRNAIAKLQSEIRNWQIRNPQNPYAKMLPTRLAGIIGFETINVSNVALLLPLEGQAQVFSDAIQSGFKAAMKESNASGVQLTVYDTTKQPVAEILQQIERSTVPTVIVGPLLKSDVNKTVNMKTPLTVLTLNKPDSAQNITNMCYFALAPEDEAREAAEFIATKKQRLPLIIAPRNDLGQRMAKAFDAQWATLNGTGALVQYFDSANDLKESMNHRTGIKLTGSPVLGAHPMPAGKVDAVYIIANQEELTLIRAMIDMEVGNRISASSVYASSRSNFSSTGPDFRLEMEGIRFSEIPLLAGSNSRVFQTALKEFNGDYSQVRLYAFGMDAWKLINSLAEIRQLPNYQIKGYTGTLTANNECVINRKLSWLEYRQGSIVAAR
jgi:outer membrane PBP1 activator LpoA protein